MKSSRSLRPHLARVCAYALTGALVVASAQALADGATAPAPAKKSATDVDPSGSFKTAAVDGAAKYAARDFPGAIAAFQKAIEASPKNTMGLYFLGEAQLAAGNLTEAEAAWTRASLEGSENKDPALRARVLFVLADLKERQKKWDEAKAAWQVYLDWAAKYPEAKAFTGSGQSRQQAIDTMLKQDKAYVVVRQRIADTKNGNVFTDLSKSPPAPAASP
jgi:tetratricopeptide (TPR) repeat protein